MDVGVKIVGLTALLEKERTVGAKTEGFLTVQLDSVGKAVAADTKVRYIEYSVAGSRGVQSKVFTSGLWVVQTIRKTRNILRRRPNFGPLMMRKAFLPAEYDNKERVEMAAAVAVREATAYWEHLS